jgi:hypothetical protein
MAVMQIVGVAGVNDSHMAARESVLMGVCLMFSAFDHRDPLSAAKEFCRYGRLGHRARLDLPNLGCIVGDCAIARELPGSRDIQDGRECPFVRIGI